MTPHERNAVGHALIRAAVFYDRADLDRTKISMMIDAIIDACPDVTSQDILQAITNYRNDRKNTIFPAPARLMSYLKPTLSDDAQAQDIASRIVQSITKFGNLESNYPALRAFIGPTGMDVVRTMGGWPYIVQHHGTQLNPGQFYAQLRDLIKVRLEMQRLGLKEGLPLIESQEQKRALPPPPITESEADAIFAKFKGRPAAELEDYLMKFLNHKNRIQGDDRELK